MPLKFFVPIVICPLSVIVFAQQDLHFPLPAPQERPLQANAPLVLVPVTVTDKRGNLVDGLTVDDFALTDDGVRQPIRLDTSDTMLAPVSIVIAVQSSGISSAALAKINKVGGMIQPLVTGTRGKAAVVAFDDEVRVIQDFTSEAAKIRAAFQQIHGRSPHSGRLIDAVSESVRMLDERPANSRRIVLILGESRDRGSKTKLPGVIEMTQRAGVMVYSATYSVYATPWTARPEDNPVVPGGWMDGVVDLVRLGSVNTADAFARSTGGRHLSFETLNGLEQTISRAGEEIHSQYLLSFVPKQTSNTGYHRIEVILPEQQGLIIRARPGYWPQ
jgi:VWFA-related protein